MMHVDAILSLTYIFVIIYKSNFTDESITTYETSLANYIDSIYRLSI